MDGFFSKRVKRNEETKKGRTHKGREFKIRYEAIQGPVREGRVYSTPITQTKNQRGNKNNIKIKKKNEVYQAKSRVTVVLPVERLQNGASKLLLLDTALGVGALHLADLAHELEEASLVVDFHLGRGLEKGALPCLSQVGTLFMRHLTLLLQVALVADQHNGDFVGVLGAENLVIQRADLLESGPRGDVVNKKKAFAITHPLVLHRAELLLPSGVQNVQQSSLIVNHDLLAVAVLNGGVIFIQKVVSHQTNGQGGFTNTTATKNNQLVFEVLCIT